MFILSSVPDREQENHIGLSQEVIARGGRPGRSALMGLFTPLPSVEARGRSAAASELRRALRAAGAEHDGVNRRVFHDFTFGCFHFVYVIHLAGLEYG